jgi:hypothetical protein
MRHYIILGTYTHRCRTILLCGLQLPETMLYNYAATGGWAFFV